jgi:FlaA1/EpsC-like NDP-sugar epimerase
MSIEKLTIRYWIIAILSFISIIIHYSIDLVNQFEIALYLWIGILVLTVIGGIAGNLMQFLWRHKVFMNSLILLSSLIVVATLFFEFEDVTVDTKHDDYLFFNYVLFSTVLIALLSISYLIFDQLTKPKTRHSYAEPTFEEARDSIINMIQDETEITHRKLYNMIKGIGVSKVAVIDEVIFELKREKILKAIKKKTKSYKVNI